MWGLLSSFKMEIHFLFSLRTDDKPPTGWLNITVTPMWNWGEMWGLLFSFKMEIYFLFSFYFLIEERCEVFFLPSKWKFIFYLFCEQMISHRQVGWTLRWLLRVELTRYRNVLDLSYRSSWIIHSALFQTHQHSAG